jgi:diguanylate cyclase (GGDEF)-like protein
MAGKSTAKKKVGRKAARTKTAGTKTARSKTGAGRAEATPAAAIARLERQLAAARRRIAELEAGVETDALTGVLNRRGFSRALRRAIAYARRYRVGAALVYLDVDHLKPINDRYGHAAGDAALRQIAGRLAGQVRVSDLIGRLGGDEFVVLMWNLTAAAAAHKAQLLEDDIALTGVEHRGARIALAVSAGATMLESDDDPERALERADRAMYARKQMRAVCG